MIKKKIVWQAEVFTLIMPLGAGETFRAPVGFVFDPHEAFILGSRVYPDGTDDSACLLAALEEAIFTYGVNPTDVCVLFGKEKVLQPLAAKVGFTLVLCDELRELAAAKRELAEQMRGALSLAN